jgi:hypothetical protein
MRKIMEKWGDGIGVLCDYQKNIRKAMNPKDSVYRIQSESIFHIFLLSLQHNPKIYLIHNWHGDEM